MTDVVSLGSVNVDRISHASAQELAELSERYDWFPDRGETVRIDERPPAFPSGVDDVRHGGKGANQAVAAAHAGAETAFYGVVGSDGEEHGVLEKLREDGVRVDRVQTASVPTGTAYVFVDPEGDNRIVVIPGANAAVDDAFVRSRYDAIRAADCLLLQNEIPVEPVATLLDELADEPDRPTVVIDPAPPVGADPLATRATVDYLTPNEHEYRALGDAAQDFDGILVRKRGDDDVLVEGDQAFSVTPPTVEPVDTTGAGDVFNGYLAARLAAGDTRRDAVELATVAGSLSTRAQGARGGVPSLSAVRTAREEGTQTDP